MKSNKVKSPFYHLTTEKAALVIAPHLADWKAERGRWTGDIPTRETKAYKLGEIMAKVSHFRGLGFRLQDRFTVACRGCGKQYKWNSESWQRRHAESCKELDDLIYREDLQEELEAKRVEVAMDAIEKAAQEAEAAQEEAGASASSDLHPECTQAVQDAKAMWEAHLEDEKQQKLHQQLKGLGQGGRERKLASSLQDRLVLPSDQAAQWGLAEQIDPTLALAAILAAEEQEEGAGFKAAARLHKITSELAFFENHNFNVQLWDDPDQHGRHYVECWGCGQRYSWGSHSWIRQHAARCPANEPQEADLRAGRNDRGLWWAERTDIICHRGGFPSWQAAVNAVILDSYWLERRAQLGKLVVDIQGMGGITTVSQADLEGHPPEKVPTLPVYTQRDLEVALKGAACTFFIPDDRYEEGLTYIVEDATGMRHGIWLFEAMPPHCSCSEFHHSDHDVCRHLLDLQDADHTLVGGRWYWLGAVWGQYSADSDVFDLGNNWVDAWHTSFKGWGRAQQQQPDPDVIIKRVKDGYLAQRKRPGLKAGPYEFWQDAVAGLLTIHKDLQQKLGQGLVVKLGEEQVIVVGEDEIHPTTCWPVEELPSCSCNDFDRVGFCRHLEADQAAMPWLEDGRWYWLGEWAQYREGSDTFHGHGWWMLASDHVLSEIGEWPRIWAEAVTTEAHSIPAEGQRVIFHCPDVRRGSHWVLGHFEYDPEIPGGGQFYVAGGRGEFYMAEQVAYWMPAEAEEPTQQDEGAGPFFLLQIQHEDDPHAGEDVILSSWGLQQRLPDMAALVAQVKEGDHFSLQLQQDLTTITITQVEKRQAQEGWPEQLPIYQGPLFIQDGLEFWAPSQHSEPVVYEVYPVGMGYEREALIYFENGRYSCSCGEHKAGRPCSHLQALDNAQEAGMAAAEAQAASEEE